MQRVGVDEQIATQQQIAPVFRAVDDGEPTGQLALLDAIPDARAFDDFEVREDHHIFSLGDGVGDAIERGEALLGLPARAHEHDGDQLFVTEDRHGLVGNLGPPRHAPDHGVWQRLAQLRLECPFGHEEHGPVLLSVEMQAACLIGEPRSPDLEHKPRAQYPCQLTPHPPGGPAHDMHDVDDPGLVFVVIGDLAGDLCCPDLLCQRQPAACVEQRLSEHPDSVPDQLAFIGEYQLRLDTLDRQAHDHAFDQRTLVRRKLCVRQDQHSHRGLAIPGVFSPAQ